MSIFEESGVKNLRKSASMPHINEIPKTHSQAFNIKKASVLDILSTVESPSHWRYFLRKKNKKDGYLNTMKSGPFIAGNTHSGFGNTVAISWKNKVVQKSMVNTQPNIGEEELYRTMKNLNFKVADELSPQQIIGRQKEQEIERIKILRNIKKKSLLLKEKRVS